jgi:hypothetical protein
VGSTVVVTGGPEAVEAVSEALRQAGAEVIAVDDMDKLDAALASVSQGSVDGYVQLPVHVKAKGASVVGRVRNFLEDGLLTRFATASTILPVLSDNARVVLVGGNTLVEASAPDDHSARLALLGVLADAIAADKSATGVEVRVLPHDELAGHIAALALGTDQTREESLAHLMAREPAISFDEWRVEVMGLVNGEF